MRGSFLGGSSSPIEFPSRIAFVLSPSNLYSNTFSGVVRQALTWADRLRDVGITVDFPACHETKSWSTYDLVHIFQYGSWAEGLIRNLTSAGVPVFLSPIVDRPKVYGWRGKLVAQIPFERLGLEQRQRVLYRHALASRAILARSELEARSLESLGIPRSAICIVRLGVDVARDQLTIPTRKSPHVFHMSHLNQIRKNVPALIAACRQVGAPLRLAGKISDPCFAAWLEKECESDPNLKYLGTLSEAQKWDELRQAHVFGLPSLNEGIGLVALEAHLAGAHVIMTKRSGGIDYFDGEVEVCDPESTADIARCLRIALSKPALEGPRLKSLTQLSSEVANQELLRVYAREKA